MEQPTFTMKVKGWTVHVHCDDKPSTETLARAYACVVNNDPKESTVVATSNALTR